MAALCPTDARGGRVHQHLTQRRYLMTNTKITTLPSNVFITTHLLHMMLDYSEDLLYFVSRKPALQWSKSWTLSLKDVGVYHAGRRLLWISGG